MKIVGPDGAPILDRAEQTTAFLDLVQESFRRMGYAGVLIVCVDQPAEVQLGGLGRFDVRVRGGADPGQEYAALLIEKLREAAGATLAAYELAGRHPPDGDS